MSRGRIMSRGVGLGRVGVGLGRVGVGLCRVRVGLGCVGVGLGRVQGSDYRCVRIRSRRVVGLK